MRWSHLLTPREWVRLSAFAAVVALLHAAGWGLFACSVAAALHTGTADLLRIEALDTGELGYLLAGGLAVAWAASVVAAKASRS